MRLTEQLLEREIGRHVASCEDCDGDKWCGAARQIEASFWNEVDRQIDEYKERRAER